MGTRRQPVCRSLYQCAGQPELTKSPPWSNDRTCGSCTVTGPAAPARSILGSRFGSWSAIAPDLTHGGTWLCRPCAWAHLAVHLRRGITIAHADGTAHFDAPPSTARAHLTGPIPADVSIIVPIGGNRIVAPRARWGHVATDNDVLPWGRHHATALTMATTLRTTFGVSVKSLAARSIPLIVLSAIPPERHADLHRLWSAFDPVRRDTILLPLMQRLTRDDTPKEPPP